MIRPFLLFLALVVAWPTVALARPTRVVIGEVQGDDDGAVGTALKASLASDVTVVGKREVSKASDKLKLSEELTDKEVKKLLKAVDADAVIKGSLDKAGDTQSLHIKLFLKTEVKPKAFTLSFANASSDKFRATLRKTILGKLGVVEGPDGSTTADDSGGGDDPPKKKKKKPAGDDTADAGGDDTADAPPKKKKKKPAGDDTADSGDAGTADDTDAAPKKKKKKKPAGDDGDGGGDDDTETPAPASSGHTANRDAVRVDFGASLTSRTLTFASRNFPQAPKPYKNGAVPGARIGAEIFPLAFSNPKGAASGLGLGFEYDKTLALTLRSQTADGTAVSAKANEQRYQVGPRFRLVFGQKPTSPSLTIAADYGSRQFTVGRGGLTAPTDIDIPDIVYKGFLPGLVLRVPFASAVAFTLDARGFLVTSAGPIGDLSSYGAAKVTGAQASAGIDIVIGNRFAVRLQAEYAQFGFAFVGNGEQAIARDGDATSKDVGGASDRYIGGAATLAVLY